MQISDNGIALQGHGTDDVRARVWIPAHGFFSRESARNHCWLWLLQRDGRVQALLLPARCLNRDDLLPDLLERLRFGDDATAASGSDLEYACVLPNAPVVPLPRWAVSWGHPVQRAIRAFADQLDRGVLDTLGDLEVPGPFFGSVQNYNRLAGVPASTRERRLRALADFPAWLARWLLEPCERPDMFGDEDDADDHWQQQPSPPRFGMAPGGIGHRDRRNDLGDVLDAIDRGRDLIGVLAGFHGVDRAMIRSPLGREPWRMGHIPPVALSLLGAMPAHARPRRCADVESRMESLGAMPVCARSHADVLRLAKAFRPGWNRVWTMLERDFPSLPQTLRDSRGFLAAAMGEAVLPAELAPLDLPRLALAWLARRGPYSLLAASRRWHAQPVQHRPADDGMPDSVPPLFGEWQVEQGTARELVTERALLDEGNAMHHCIADYWRRCVHEATRIVHLELPDGETGTAQYDMDESQPMLPVHLAQLRGSCNGDPSAAMKRFAEGLGERLCGENFEAMRHRLADAARAEREHCRPGSPFQSRRALDARSRAELAQVLVWAATQADWQVRKGELLCTRIAGFHYACGPRLLDRLGPGDTLTLAREPGNTHDPSAVRIEWNGAKLGYIPRAENAAIARLLDRGDALSAHIHAIDLAERWAPVTLAILPAG